MSYYQEGCNIDHLTWSKVLIGHPSENPERKPCETNSRIFRWSSCDLVDQITLINLGLDFSGLDQSDRSGGPVWPVQGPIASLFEPTGLTGLGDRSDRSGGPVWPVCTDRAMASFWEWGIYTPQLSSLRAAGSLTFLELLEAKSWPASSPQHSLWVVLTWLHILWFC